MKTVTLTTCENSIEANLIKGLLKSHGINCFLTNENFSNIMPQFNGIMGAGVEVMIDERDLEDAKKLIDHQLIRDENVCPNCSSSNIKFGLGPKRTRKILAILFSLFAWVSFGYIKNTWYCKDCKIEFKK
jgi:hypothetical protein